MASDQLLRQTDDLVFLWGLRLNQLNAQNVRLFNLVWYDERIAAHVDALMIAGASAWEPVHDQLKLGLAGVFFASGVLAVERAESDSFGKVFHLALDVDRHRASEPYDPIYDPWRGLVSAVAWADRAHAGRVVDRLLQRPEARMRWLGIATCGTRRGALDGVLERALADGEAVVRARAYRTAGELGRFDLVSGLTEGMRDEDPECRFWSAWAAARLGESGSLRVLSEIARGHSRRAEAALDLLLRRLDVHAANDWLRDFAKLPDRERSLIRGAGAIGDPNYIPWLIEHMNQPEHARLAGEAFSMIAGVDLAYRDLDQRPPEDFQSGPNDDPSDENVALDEDERLPWPDHDKIAAWWMKNRTRFDSGTPYFLGEPKASANWLRALSDAFQRQRRAAALELAIRQPNQPLFEVRARGRLQRQLIARLQNG